MSTTKITNNANAAAWIAENLPGVQIVDGLYVDVSTACKRCGGSGEISGYRHVAGGVCFECSGAKTAGRFERQPVKTFAQHEKAKLTARKRAQEAAERKRLAGVERMKDRNEAAGFGRVTDYERNLKIQAQRMAAAKQGHHVGEEGKRGEFVLTLERVVGIDNRYGTRYLHIFCTEDGSRVVWWATKPLGIALNTPTTIVATVKEHGAYDGAPQTTITRAKVA